MPDVQVKSAEVYRAADGWRFRIKAANGEVIAMGEAYADKRDAFAAARGLTDEVKEV